MRIETNIIGREMETHASQFSGYQEPVTLYSAFPVQVTAQSLSSSPTPYLHQHDAYEFGVCLSGNGLFVVGNRIYSYEAGDTLIIAPGVFHRGTSCVSNEDAWYFVYLNPEQWGAVRLKRDISVFLHKANDRGIASVLVQVANELERKEEGYRTCVQGLITTMLVQTMRVEETFPPESFVPRTPFHLIDERINRSIDVMLNAEKKMLSISTLARECGLSEPHFRHLFRNQVGISPKRFQIKLKINTAMNLLKGPSPRVVEVSEACGFESLSSFNRQFKQETGLSPLQWRQQVKHRGKRDTR